MKKFLIILMVVAMASFLFVGCIPTVPEVEEEEEPVVPVPASEAPYITKIVGIDLLSTVTEYINSTEAGSVKVSGVGKINSIIKVYINDVWVGTGATGLIGTFEVAISATDLGKEGEKTLYATAIESGLAESAPSTVYKFTLDTTAPKVITSAFGISDTTSGLPLGYILVTFDEAVKGITATGVWTGTVQSPIVTNVPVTATVKSATVAKLTEVTKNDLKVNNLFRVDCPTTITDLAGNELDTVYNVALGTVL